MFSFFSGNVLLIGPIGSQLSELAALALYMLEYPIHTIDCSYRGSFLDGLRSAVRRAGCDGKTTTLVIKVSRSINPLASVALLGFDVFDMQ